MNDVFTMSVEALTHTQILLQDVIQHGVCESAQNNLHPLNSPLVFGLFESLDRALESVAVRQVRFQHQLHRAKENKALRSEHNVALKIAIGMLKAEQVQVPKLLEEALSEAVWQRSLQDEWNQTRQAAFVLISDYVACQIWLENDWETLRQLHSCVSSSRSRPIRRPTFLEHYPCKSTCRVLLMIAVLWDCQMTILRNYGTQLSCQFQSPLMTEYRSLYGVLRDSVVHHPRVVISITEVLTKGISNMAQGYVVICSRRGHLPSIGY